jgi:HSP20 family protein
MDLPEMNQNEIEIKIEENTLIIQGERKFIKESPDASYLQIQRPFGTFQRTFALPGGIDQEKIKAGYKDGVLRIALPKKVDRYPKQITVEET